MELKKSAEEPGRFNDPNEGGTSPKGMTTFLKWLKEKLLIALLYFEALSIAASILGFAVIGGYLYGSVQTTKEYDSILGEFTENVESQRVFYFLGYKVVPSANVVTVNAAPEERAHCGEERESVLRNILNRVFSQEIGTKLDEKK